MVSRVPRFLMLEESFKYILVSRMFSGENKLTFNSFIFNQTDSLAHEPINDHDVILNGSSSPALLNPPSSLLVLPGTSVIDPVSSKKRPSPRSSLSTKKKRKTNKSSLNVESEEEEEEDREESHKISYILGHVCSSFLSTSSND